MVNSGAYWLLWSMPLTKTYAERIAFELDARVRNGRAITDDATVIWIQRELATYGVMLFGPRLEALSHPGKVAD